MGASSRRTEPLSGRDYRRIILQTSGIFKGAAMPFQAESPCGLHNHKGSNHLLFLLKNRATCKHTMGNSNLSNAYCEFDCYRLGLLKKTMVEP